MRPLAASSRSSGVVNFDWRFSYSETRLARDGRIVSQVTARGVAAHAPGVDSNLTTKELAILAAKTVNRINAKIYGSPHWTRFELLQPETACVRTGLTRFFARVSG